MTKITIREIGIHLTQAGRLKSSPLCIYGSDTSPQNAIPIKNINRCIANAIFALSVHKISILYISERMSCRGVVQEDKHGLVISLFYQC